MHKLRIGSLLAALAFCLLMLTGCASGTTNDASKSINITSSVDFYGEVAKYVVGNHGNVTSIISNPNVDPHEFNPTSNDAKSVYKANVMIYNGLSYDSWAQKLVKSDSKAEPIDVGKLMNKDSSDNPHIWYNVDTMEKLANTLADHFAKLQPKHAKEFRANAKNYCKQIMKLNDQLKNIKKHKINKPVAVSEPVFDYSLEKMGYKVSDPSFEYAIEKGNDPSPRSIRKLQDDIVNHKIAFFVVNRQVENSVISSFVDLAKQNNIPIVQVTETKPSRSLTYLSWMQEQYTQVQNAQK